MKMMNVSFRFLSFLATASTALLLGVQPSAQAQPSADISNCHIHHGPLQIHTGQEWPQVQAPCLVIGGDLTIRHNTPPPAPVVAVQGSVKVTRFNGENLQLLRGLTRVDRDLEIEKSHALVNLSGLEDLEFVGEDLEIENNRKLQNIDALGKLTRVGESVQIENNASLTSLRGFARLEQVVGGFDVEQNPQLRTLEGLERLQSVGGDLGIESNSQLQNLDALQRVQHVGGDLEIKHNSSLQSVRGLEALQNVSKDVEIENNRRLCQRDAAALATRLNKPVHKVVRNQGRCR